MKILNLSMECYPVAKVGGLADVVGALPKYLNKIDGVNASVVMPWYNKPYVHEHDFEKVFDGFIWQKDRMRNVLVYRQVDCDLGFDLFLVKIPGLLDRDNVYGYWDESEQFLAFQHGVMHWLCAMHIKPDVLHCHDYHTGLVPFMIEHCPEFRFLKGTKTVGTIHNGEYQGAMSYNMLEYFPWFDGTKIGLLDWNGRLNPLAAMLKCCHAFNTVSNGYLQELFENFRGLESLVGSEYRKAYGIVNGIDTYAWNPETDPMISHHYNSENAGEGKYLNKAELCAAFGLNPALPLISFIGRFAGEKGADLLPEIIQRSIRETHGSLNLVVLGSGNRELENRLLSLSHTYSNFAVDLGYKEYLSHQIYASSDFLLMPSRVEPCGLNQMYSMRYGTVPIVRYTGGLKDTVEDISTGGAGLNFTEPTADAAVHAIKRALHIYGDSKYFNELIKSNMKFNFSWNSSAGKYLNLYQHNHH